MFRDYLQIARWTAALWGSFEAASSYRHLPERNRRLHREGCLKGQLFSTALQLHDPSRSFHLPFGRCMFCSRSDYSTLQCKRWYEPDQPSIWQCERWEDRLHLCETNYDHRNWQRPTQSFKKGVQRLALVWESKKTPQRVL